MDRGGPTGRGRALWTTLGIVVALALIGGSLLALNRSLLSFDGWLSGSGPGTVQQTLPPEPKVVVGATRFTGGSTPAAPGIPGASDVALVPILPTADGGGGVSGTGTPGGAAGGLGWSRGSGGTVGHG